MSETGLLSPAVPKPVHIPDRPRVPQARPIGLDPPEHTKYRAPLQKTFSPKAAAEQLPVRVFIKMPLVRDVRRQRA
jgi:cytochrome P450